MQADGSDRPGERQIDTRLVRTTIQDIRMSLTVILGYAELLERRSQNGAPMIEGEFRSHVAHILGAARMINDHLA